MSNPRCAGVLILGFALAACGGAGVDETAVLTEACETQQGIGWLKREYGENYCACWAGEAKTALSADNYKTFVKASQESLKAADKADREMITRQHTEIFSAVSSAAKKCAKAG